MAKVRKKLLIQDLTEKYNTKIIDKVHQKQEKIDQPHH